MFREFWFKNNPSIKPIQSESVSPPAVAGILQVKSEDQLLSPHAGCMRQVDELAGLSKEHFQRYYLQPIRNFARFVQLLPASEAHHHAGPGGLLAHGLDVCINALKRRRSYLLSESGGAEEISEKQDLWTYAVFMAALCHDLAKAAVDQRVIVYDNARREAVWEPWHRFIDEQGLWYTTEFVRHQQYRLHEKASPLLVHRIIPSQGMSWLASDPHILSQWLASVSGDLENAGMIGEIVSLADQQSVAVNLGADGARMPGVRTRPLHEKMLTALRFLLTEGELPLNRNGAAGWIKGDDCWLVSKRTVDAIRDQLMGEGHSGIPAKNGRLFDILQEHGILHPCGEKAIWTAAVAGDGWCNELTMIRVPVSRLWPNPANKPAEFEGSIQPIFPQQDPVAKKNPDAIVGQSEQTPSQAKTTEHFDPDVQSQHHDAANSPDSDESDLLQFLPSGVENKTDISDSPKGEPAAANNQQNQMDFVNDTDPVSQFFDWIQAGIRKGQLKVNQAKARIHVVDEGIILVTPGIFQDFAQSSANSNDLAWSVIQQKVLKKNWHVRDAKGLNVVKYQIKGKNKSTAINAVLFQDKTRIFGGREPPASNPHLFRKDRVTVD